jgi:hypothetical protein
MSHVFNAPRALTVTGPAIPRVAGQPALVPLKLEGTEAVNALFNTGSRCKHLTPCASWAGKAPILICRLVAMHSAVKWGNEKAAGYLGSSFDTGDPLVGRVKDRARADRHDTLAKALRLNSDLRFPNLDKAPLPK